MAVPEVPDVLDVSFGTEAIRRRFVQGTAATDPIAGPEQPYETILVPTKHRSCHTGENPR